MPELDSAVLFPSRVSYSGLNDTHGLNIDPWNGLLDDTMTQ
jgi:hypothetical protein